MLSFVNPVSPQRTSLTGGDGNTFYGNGNAADTSPADQTVTTIGTQYTAFEVRWLDVPPAGVGTSVLFSGRAGQSSSGGLTFFRQSSSDWTLSLH
jgi:hypothetical protein